MKKDYDITKAKLIIWDMDETFWRGNISEGDVEFKPEVVEFIKELTLKGIMNSICSKNYYSDVKSKFLERGYKDIWELFVFPSIDWSPKGERVKNIIKSMNLRNENVIFIDDNRFNLNEVKYYCPGIMTAATAAKMIEELYLVNDYDFEYTRLKQYKILEKKSRAKSESVSNENFLRSSDVKICIKKDCLNHIERIKKLIQRTNQLNFTKFRDENAEDTIRNNEAAYIIAEDKFGNYGICGFYVLKNHKLIHFLFSCRIMDMGIEQFVYSLLGKPELRIIGDVSSNLTKPVDWITVVENLEVTEKKPQKTENVNILFKGPCDLYSALSYIDAECNIDTEFPYWNKQLIYILAHTHTAFIEQTHKLPKNKIIELTKRFPFPSADEFKTGFFDSKYNVIFLSLLTVTHSGIYINKSDGSYVMFGYADCDITDENNWEKILAPIPPEAREQNLPMLHAFKEEYIFGGNPPVDLVIQNLNYILDNLKCSLVLILGSEISTKKTQAGYENMAERHKILNAAVRKHFSGKVDFIELTGLINGDDDYTACIDHFSRRVYVNLAQKIINIANSKLGKNYLHLKQ